MRAVVEFDGVLVAAGHIETSQAQNPAVTTTVAGQADAGDGPYWSAAMWVSADGTEWTRVPDDGTFSDGQIYALAVTPDGTGLVAVGDAVWVWSPLP